MKGGDEEFKNLRPTSSQAIRHKRAVPPGYLHDLLQSRNMLKTVGLRSGKQQIDTRLGLKSSNHPKTNANLRHYNRHVALHQDTRGKRVVQGSRTYNKVACSVGTRTLPQLFEHRKKFLLSKRSIEKDVTPYRNHPEKPIGLLSLPEDVLLKIVCLLDHDDIKPLFQVCKELGTTLRNAVKFHFNYATPVVAAHEDAAPQAKRPAKKRALTAYADVMAHLRRGQRHVVESGPSISEQSTGPRALSFTPLQTPQGTPVGKQDALDD